MKDKNLDSIVSDAIINVEGESGDELPKIWYDPTTMIEVKYVHRYGEVPVYGI